MLEPRQLGLHLLRPFEVGCGQAAVFGFPIVAVGIWNAVLAADVTDLQARIGSFRIERIRVSLNRVFFIWASWPKSAR